MKKILLLAGLTFFMMSCSESPSSVAENFAVSVGKGKIEEAKKYCTESTGMLLDMSASFGGVQPDPDFSIKILRDSVVDNRAWVFYTEKDRTKEHSLDLVKIDGEWKVTINRKK